MASGAISGPGDLTFGGLERPRASAPLRRLPWLLILSLALHAGLLSALLFLRLRPKEPEWLPPPAVDVVYDNGGSKQAPSVPNPAPKQANAPASPAPEPEATPPPAPPPVPLPTPPVPPAPSPEPVPEPEATPQPQPAPTPPQPSPTIPKPAPAQTPPQVAPIPTPPQEAQLPIPPQATEVPPEPAPAPAPPVAAPKPAPPTTAPEKMESAIQLIPPTFPPPPQLKMPEAMAPPRLAPTRPIAPPRPRSPFPTPMVYSLGPSSPASPTARPGRRRVDLAFAPGSGADSLQPLARSDDPDVGADWLQQVAAWWKRHSYYPPEAGMNGEQGIVTVGMEVRHDGQVEAIRLETRSGSQWLDLASLAIFRDAKLPPLPPNVSAAQIPLHFTIDYVIVN